MPTAALTRSANTDKRNQKLRDAFYARYTSQPRPRKLSREYVVSQLAEEYFECGPGGGAAVWGGTVRKGTRNKQPRLLWKRPGLFVYSVFQ
jgi:hypothetical protein